MRLTWVPAVTALLPAVAIHLSYLIAADAGHVPWCVPYVDSCTSISATGRQGLERLVFRAGMMPAAALMMLYWTLAYLWLRALHSPWRRANRAMLVLGVIACLGLLLYVTVLGVIGEAYALQRRLGVTFFFALTVAAQGLLTLQLYGLAHARAAAVSRAVRRALAGLSLAVLALGAASLLLPLIVSFYRDIQDAVAWTATLLILLHVLVTGRAWRQTGFSAHFEVAGTGRAR